MFRTNRGAQARPKQPPLPMRSSRQPLTASACRLILTFVACVCATASLIAKEPLLRENPPLLTEAKRQFDTMKSTFYQYRIEVDRDAGSYRYDCVGFVSYSLKQVAPEAWASVFKATGIGKNRIPSPPKYQVFFASLSTTPQPGWQAVTKVSDLKPGDIVSWDHRTKSAVGHAVILASTPQPLPDKEGSWKVEIYDSTSSPHSDDTRPTDDRAQPLPSNGRRSGLGKGTMVLVADPATGRLTGLAWSLRAKAVTVPIAAGRPVS